MDQELIYCLIGYPLFPVPSSRRVVLPSQVNRSKVGIECCPRGSIRALKAS